jgi:hypothetical protein
MTMMKLRLDFSSGIDDKQHQHSQFCKKKKSQYAFPNFPMKKKAWEIQDGTNCDKHEKYQDKGLSK